MTKLARLSVSQVTSNSSQIRCHNIFKDVFQAILEMPLMFLLSPVLGTDVW